MIVMWSSYRKMKPPRHYYEVIPEGTTYCKISCTLECITVRKKNLAVKTLANPTIGILADKKFGELCKVLSCWCDNLEGWRKKLGQIFTDLPNLPSFYRQVFLPYGSSEVWRLLHYNYQLYSTIIVGVNFQCYVCSGCCYQYNDIVSRNDIYQN